MRKQTQRKFLIQVLKTNQPDTHFWKDPVSLIKEKEKTSGIKTVQGNYHLLVVEEEMMTAAVKKNQIEGSRGILNCVKKLKCQQVTMPKSRPKIERKWWLNRGLRFRQKEKSPSPSQNHF